MSKTPNTRIVQSAESLAHQVLYFNCAVLHIAVYPYVNSVHGHNMAAEGPDISCRWSNFELMAFSGRRGMDVSFHLVKKSFPRHGPTFPPTDFLLMVLDRIYYLLSCKQWQRERN